MAETLKYQEVVTIDVMKAAEAAEVVKAAHSVIKTVLLPHTVIPYSAEEACQKCWT